MQTRNYTQVMKLLIKKIIKGKWHKTKHLQLFEREEENRWYNIYYWNPLSAAACKELHTREDHTRDFFLLLQIKFSVSQLILSFLLIFSLTASTTAKLGQHYELLFTWLEESICSHTISTPLLISKLFLFIFYKGPVNQDHGRNRNIASKDAQLRKDLSLLYKSSYSWEHPHHTVVCSALGPQNYIFASVFQVST